MDNSVNTQDFPGETIHRLEHDLRESTKELNCLYGIAHVADRSDSTLEEILQGIVDLLPQAWQYPDKTCSRITMGTQEFRTVNFKETPFRQASRIAVHGEHVGKVEVLYLEESPECEEGPFLKEERRLIEMISGRLGKLIEQKTAEDVIRRSEEKYRNFYDNAMVGIFHSTPEGRYLRVNPALAMIHGFSSPDDMVRTVTDIGEQLYTNPRDRKHYMELLEDTDMIRGFEARLYRKDKGTVWISMNVRVVRDQDGSVSYYEGVVEDITHRKMAEEKLKQQADAIEASADGIAVLSAGQDYVYVNNAHARIYGYDGPEELVGRSWAVLYDEKELQRFKDDIMPEFIQKGWWQGEATGRKKDGNSFPQEVSLTALDNGGLICVVRDITERKRMRDALRESEEKYRNIFENALEGIFRTTPEGRILDANPALAHICGFDSPQEMMDALTDIGTQLYAHPEDRIRLKELLREQGFAERFEAQFHKRDGNRVWVCTNIHAVTDTEGNIAFHEGILVDITDHKKAEEELRTTHQRLFDIIEFLPDATLVIDNEKKVMAWNLACEEMTGVRKEDIIGKGTYAYSIPFYGEGIPILIDYVTMDTDELQQRYASIRRKGHRLYGEAFTPMLYNGKGAFLSGNASPLFDRKGKVVGAIESIRDITEVKHLETQLRQAQKMESIGTLAGGIAHDFNNILTSLMGYASLIQMKMDKGNPLRSHVDQILSASEKAADLTGSLLTFSRKQPVALVALDISDTIRETEKLLKRLLREDIELRTSFVKDETIVMADRSQIDQILFNLVTNAKDAMPKGGTLVIETGLTVMDEGFTRVHGFGEPGRYVLISISDTGTGMDETTQEKIFDPFFTTKETGKGTGLGLATVYGIVKQHNGYITVYSEPGHGATFRIYLPAVSTRVDEEQREAVPIGRGSETILIAEDDEEVRHFIHEAIKHYGYRTIEAVDGEDALGKFREHRDVDLVILDSVMPKKNGREVYGEIRATDPHMKVLFMSGYTKDVVLDKGIKDREVDFIAKPLSFDKLLQKIREVLDKCAP